MPSYHFCAFVLVSFCAAALAAITKQQCPGPPDDLYVFENDCFYFHINENATFEEAEAACSTIKDRHMVTVKSMEISKFLQKHLTDTYNVSSHIWIGLMRVYNPKEPKASVLFQWVDDSQTIEVDEKLLKSINAYGDLINQVSEEGDYILKDKDRGNPYVCQYQVKKATSPKPTPITEKITLISPTSSLKSDVNKKQNTPTLHENTTLNESSPQNLRTSIVSSISPTGVVTITVTKTVQVTKTQTTTVVEKKTVTETVTETRLASSMSSIHPSPSSSSVAAIKSDSVIGTKGFSVTSTIAPSAAEATVLKSDIPTPSVKELQSSSYTSNIITSSSFDRLASSSSAKGSLSLPTPQMTFPPNLSLSPSKVGNEISPSITQEEFSTAFSISALPGPQKEIKTISSEKITVASSISNVTPQDSLSNAIIMSESNPSQSPKGDFMNSPRFSTKSQEMLASIPIDISETVKTTQEIIQIVSFIDSTKTDKYSPIVFDSTASGSALKISPTASFELDSSTMSTPLPKLSKIRDSITGPPNTSGKYLKSTPLSESTQLNTHDPIDISSHVLQVTPSLETTQRVEQKTTLSPTIVIKSESSLTTSPARVSNIINPSTFEQSSQYRSIKPSVITTPIITITTPPVTPRGPCPNIDENNGKYMHLFREKCLYFEVNKRVQFETAKNFCQQNGGSLAMIKNSDTQAFIEQTLHDIIDDDKISPLWIGIMRNSTDRKYYWMDGESVQYSRFHATFRKLKSVVILSNTGNWMPFNSIYAFNFICEFKAFIIKSTAIESMPSSQYMSIGEDSSIGPEIFPSSQLIFSQDNSPTIPSIFPRMSSDKLETLPSIILPSSVFTTEMPSTTQTDMPSTAQTTTDNIAVTSAPLPFQPCYQFQDNCYYFYLKQRTSFHRANQFCKEHNSSIVQIKTQEIQSFIQYVLTEKLTATRFGIFWIGLQLNSTKNDGVYYWMDGEAASYSNFMVPSPYKTTVVISSTGKWMDINQRFTAYFICQYNTPVPIIPTVESVQPSSSDLTPSSLVPSKMPSYESSTATLPISKISSKIIEEVTTIPGSHHSSQSIDSPQNSPTRFVSATTFIIPSKKFITTALSASIKPSSTIATELLHSTQTPNPNTKTPAPCHQFEDKCFYFHLEDKVIFDKAEDFCQENGGSLAQIKTSMIQSFIQQTLQEILTIGEFHLMWIGLKRSSTNNDNQYYWIDGDMATYQNFQSSSPFRDRVVMFSTTGVWKDLPAMLSCNFICEFDTMTMTQETIPPIPTNTMQNSFMSTVRETSVLTGRHTTTPGALTTTTSPADSCQRFGDKCFKFELKKRLTFQNANQFCQQSGGSLALIKTKEIQTFIEKALVNTHVFSYFDLMWIGLQHDPAKKDDSYYWIDGEIARYNNFEFRRLSREKDGVAMVSTNGQWIGVNKGFTCYFICEFDLAITVPASTPVAPTNSATTKDLCPFKNNRSGTLQDDDKYVQVFENKKCLYFNMDAHITFQAAKNECQKYGGSLVMIKSEELQDFIEIQFNETLKLDYYYRVWIGLYKDPAKQDGKYYWLDGTQLNYDHFKFAPATTTNSTGENVVLILGGGYWLETTLQHSKNGFVCEYDLQAP